MNIVRCDSCQKDIKGLLYRLNIFEGPKHPIIKDKELLELDLCQDCFRLIDNTIAKIRNNNGRNT